MELTNILGKLKSDKELPKPFLALELSDDLVQAAVWQVEEGKTVVTALGAPVEWKEGDKDNTLIQAVDATISSAVEGMAVEPGEVVFGLPTSWTTPTGIDENKLKLVKLISHELELKPLGFVVILDSLLRYLKMQEGTPSTSLLIQVSHDQAVINLVKLGRLEGSQTVVRSDDIATDVEEGISRLQVQDNLPSRIIVFDGMHNLEEIVQNLVSYDWQSKFKFLHLPKVESLPKDVVIRSIAIAGGAEVAKAIGFEISEPKPQSAPEPQPKADPPMASTTISLDSPPLSSASDFGFSTSTSSQGLSSTGDLAGGQVGTPKVGGESLPVKSAKKLPLKLPKLSLPHFSFRGIKPPKLGGRLGILVLGAILLLTIIGFSVWLIPHATVTIFVKPKVLEEVVSLTLSTTNSSINVERQLVPGQLQTTTVSGDASVNTTGSKTIGDPASGEVVIYNRSDLVKTFPEGTIISSQGMDFTLDSEVTVSSSSAGADYVNVPGKTTAQVTAKAIGDGGNLKENSEFTIGDFSTSTYIARNESSLSGGSSSEIRVVSQDDLDSVIAKLSETLSEEARTQLANSTSPGTSIYLLEDSLKVKNESYSDEVGDEADVLEASLEIEIGGISYLNTDVESLVASAIESAIPPGYVRTADIPTVELSGATDEGNGQVIADARVKVFVLPTLPTSSLQTALRGLSSQEIESALSGIVGLDSARVEITPKFLPPRWKRMPRNPQNISVTIEPVN